MRALFAPPVAGQTSPVGGVLEMTNIGTAECRVQTKVVWWVGAKPADIRSTDELGRAAVIDPGGRAVSALTWWGQECTGDAPLDAIHVAFFSNHGLPEATIPATGLSRGPCARPSGDVGSGSWAAPVRRLDFYYPHDVLTQLVPALVSPPSGEVNVPIPFTLVLTNVTEHAAVFDHPHPPGGTVSCPVVSFNIGDLEPERRTLDCKPGTSIPPAGSARYEFEFTTDLSFECITRFFMHYDELPGAGTSAPLVVEDCGSHKPKEPASSG